MDFLLCKICKIHYDEEDHRPRHAPCGHELCTSCIRALIKDSIFECPKCRQTNKVCVPDDMPVNFGLIDVIRAFKTKNIPSSSSSVPGATNEEMCSIHCKSITHWCRKCLIWICDDCLESHSSILGCSTISSTEAMKNLKDKHINNSDILLAIFREDINYMSAKLQEHTELVEKRTEEIKSLCEEAKTLRFLIEQGNTHEQKFIESKNHLGTANSPNAVSDGIKVLTHRKQLLRSWSVINLGSDTPLGLSKAFADKKNVFTMMEIDFMQKYAELTQHEEFIYLHTFWNQTLTDGSICMSFDRLQKIIPPNPSLVFFELSLGGVLKGKLLLRLNKDLPQIREYMVILLTGQKGKSFKNVNFTSKCENHISITSCLQFTGIPVTADKCEGYAFKRGDVIGNYASGSLLHMYWYVGTQPSIHYNNHHLVGTFEKGLDILQECHTKHTGSAPLAISDCGLVIEPQ